MGVKRHHRAHIVFFFNTRKHLKWKFKRSMCTRNPRKAENKSKEKVIKRSEWWSSPGVLPRCSVLWSASVWLLALFCSSAVSSWLTAGFEAGQWSWERVRGAPWWWQAALSRSLRIWRMMVMPLRGWLTPVWLQGARVPDGRRRKRGGDGGEWTRKKLRR